MAPRCVSEVPASTAEPRWARRRTFVDLAFEPSVTSQDPCPVRCSPRWASSVPLAITSMRLAPNGAPSAARRRWNGTSALPQPPAALRRRGSPRAQVVPLLRRPRGAHRPGDALRARQPRARRHRNHRRWSEAFSMLTSLSRFHPRWQVDPGRHRPASVRRARRVRRRSPARRLPLGQAASPSPPASF